MLKNVMLAWYYAARNIIGFMYSSSLRLIIHKMTKPLLGDIASQAVCGKIWG